MRIAAEIIHTVGETEASFGGVQLVRDNRLDVRRTGHLPGGRTPPGHPLVPSIFPMPRQTQSCEARSPLGTGTRSPFQAEPVQSSKLIPTKGTCMTRYGLLLVSNAKPSPPPVEPNITNPGAYLPTW